MIEDICLTVPNLIAAFVASMGLCGDGVLGALFILWARPNDGLLPDFGVKTGLPEIKKKNVLLHLFEPQSNLTYSCVFGYANKYCKNQ